MEVDATTQHVRGRTTAIVYMCIGAGILGVSLALLLVLFFTQGFIYWYFIFGCLMGAILLIYGLAMLVRFLRLRRYAETHPEEANARPQSAAVDVETGIPAEVLADYAQNPPKNLPEPTAPPSQFIQDFDTSGEIELKDFDVSPVQYGYAEKTSATSDPNNE